MTCLKEHNTETVDTVYVPRYIHTTRIPASGKLNKLAMVMAKISKFLLTLHTFQSTATPLCLCLLFLFTFTLLIELIREIYKF